MYLVPSTKTTVLLFLKLVLRTNALPGCVIPVAALGALEKDKAFLVFHNFRGLKR